MNIVIVVLVAASLIVNVITLVVVLSRRSGTAAGSARNSVGPGGGVNEQLAAMVQTAASVSPKGIVFCRSCGSQHDSSLKECPTCKTAR